MFEGSKSRWTICFSWRYASPQAIFLAKTILRFSNIFSFYLVVEKRLQCFCIPMGNLQWTVRFSISDYFIHSSLLLSIALVSYSLILNLLSQICGLDWTIPFNSFTDVNGPLQSLHFLSTWSTNSEALAFFLIFSHNFFSFQFILFFVNEIPMEMKVSWFSGRITFMCI